MRSVRPNFASVEASRNYLVSQRARWVTERPSHAKVSQLYNAPTNIDQHVFGFQITVDNASYVAIAKGLQHLAYKRLDGKSAKAKSYFNSVWKQSSVLIIKIHMPPEIHI